MSGVDINTIYNQLNYLDETKQQLRTALINKGQTVPVSQPFRNYVDNINNLGTAKLYNDINEMTNDTTVVNGTFGTVYNNATNTFSGIYSYVRNNWSAVPTQFQAGDDDVLSVAYMGKDGPSVGNLDTLKEFEYSNINNAKKYIWVARNIMKSIDTSKSNNIRPLITYARDIGAQQIDFLTVGNACDNAYGLFYNVGGIISTNNWDTSNITNMSNMFCNSEYLYNIKTTNFNTSQVVNMSNMFYNCKRLQDVDARYWDTSNVTNMFGLFFNCSHLGLVANFMTQNCQSVVDISSMFRNCSSILNITFGDIGNFTYANYVFTNCILLQTILNFNVNNAEYVTGMFNGCGRLTQLYNCNFNLYKAKTCQQMFYGCSSLNNSINIYGPMENVENITNMFGQCSNLSSIKFIGGINTENLIALNDCFNGCTNLTSVNGFNFNLPNVNGIVANVFNATNVWEYNMRNCYMPNVTALTNFFSKSSAINIDMNNCILNKVAVLDFSGYNNLRKVGLDNVYIPNLYKLSFQNDSNLSEITLTANTVIYLNQVNSMFKGCSNLYSLTYYNGFNTSKATNMSYMFQRL